MEAEVAAYQERINKLSVCKNSNEYKLYNASNLIVSNQEAAHIAQQEINRQKEGAKISGYVDKQVMYTMGNRIAEINRVNKENFEFYKKVGGSARNIESVRSLPNPCNM